MRLTGWLWRAAIAVLVIAALFYQLGKRGLNEPDEGRYAEVGREMMASGDWVTPRLNGVEHLSKPPLTYWLIALSLKTFGVNEFAARLPSALAAIGTLCAVYLFGRSVRGEWVGLWAVLILVSSVEFFVMARTITTDMLLTCFVTWSVWAMWRWHASDRCGFGGVVWFYVFLGLGFMTKGPVAIVLPLFALLGLRWRSSRCALREMHWGKGVLILLAMSLPWFLAVTWGHSSRWDYFVRYEIIARLFDESVGRTESWWFFFPILAGGFLPWTPLVLFSVFLLDAKADWLSDEIRLCVAWIGLGLFLFSCSESKLPTYVLPLLPPLALIAAAALEKAVHLRSAQIRRRWAQRGLAMSVAVFLLVGIGGLLIAHTKYGLRWTQGGVPLAFLVVGTITCLLFLAIRYERMSAIALAITSLVTMLAVVWLIPSIERHLSHLTPARFVAERIRRENPTRDALVLTYNVFQRGLPFYLGQTVLWYHPPKRKSETGGSEEKWDNWPRPVDPERVVTSTQFREAMIGSRRAICVTGCHSFVRMQQELGIQLHVLGQVENLLLISNQPRSAPPPSS